MDTEAMQLGGDSLLLDALKARAAEIVRRAHGRGLEPAVVLVDRSGEVLGSLGDGEAAREAARRAKTSASLGISTAELAARVRGASGLPGVSMSAELGAGGLPVFLDGRLIGGIGVSGGDARTVASLGEALRLLARGEAATAAATANGIAAPAPRKAA